MRARGWLGCAVALMTQAAVAQDLQGEEYVNFTGRPDAFSLVRATVRRGARGYAGELTARSVVSWPYAETLVRTPFRIGPMQSRTALIPLPVGPNDAVTVALDGEDRAGVFTATTSASTSSGVDATFVAIVGLGERVAFDFNTAANGLDMIGGAVRAGDDPADVALPTVPSAWGGVNAVIAGADVLIRATPEGRTALRQWVELGGVLVISPRTTADLRAPWIASMVGPVEDSPDGGRRFGEMSVEPLSGAASRRVGLGSAHVLPMDLSLASWDADAATVRQFQGLVRRLARSGGGLLSPGELGLFRKVTEGGDPQNVVRPFVNLRPVMLPIALLLTAYIVAVGLMLSGQAGRRAPMKRLMQLPLLACGVLGLVVVTSYLARSGASSARVIAVYDTASGSPLAMRRVVAGLTAGRSRTFDLPSPEGTLAVFRAGSAAANGVLRWDGARTSIERVRLGMFETGMYYAEGPVELGAITVSFDPGGAPRLENRSRLVITEARYEAPTPGRVFEFGAAAPGASVTPSGEHQYARASLTDRLWGAGRWPQNFVGRGARSDIHRVFFDEMLASPAGGHADGFLWALVRVPEEVVGMFPGFAIEQSVVAVRVVVRLGGAERAVAQSRLGARTYLNSESNDASEPVPMETTASRVDGGALGDASAVDMRAIFEALGASDGAVTQ